MTKKTNRFGIETLLITVIVTSLLLIGCETADEGNVLEITVTHTATGNKETFSAHKYIDFNYRLTLYDNSGSKITEIDTVGIIYKVKEVSKYGRVE